jgi:hypothetical protein
VGDPVEEGEPIGEVLYRRGDAKVWEEKFLSCYTFSDSPVARPELIKEKVI